MASTATSNHAVGILEVCFTACNLLPCFQRFITWFQFLQRDLEIEVVVVLTTTLQRLKVNTCVGCICRSFLSTKKTATSHNRLCQNRILDAIVSERFYRDHKLWVERIRHAGVYHLITICYIPCLSFLVCIVRQQAFSLVCFPHLLWIGCSQFMFLLWPVLMFHVGRQSNFLKRIVRDILYCICYCV